MSRISDVMKNKNRVEKLRQTRRREEISSMKNESAFKARLYDELNRLNFILEQGEVDCIIIKIPDAFLANFGAAIYGADLVEYNIEQVESEPNKFYVRRKFVAF